jgi:hypothetical protein
MADQVTIKSGTAHVIQIPFAAFPKAKVTWTFNGGKFPEPKRMKQETILGATALQMSKIVKKDEGAYKVHIKNEYGEIDFTTTVHVIGETQFVD